MREILFRAKDCIHQQWFYGWYFYTSEFTWSQHNIISTKDWMNVKTVNPETVTQYTGLTDKNGTKIFEGDIVRFIDIDFDGSERKAVGVIAWNIKAANFDIVKGTYRLDFHYPVFEEIEVIGNIYDNPELLETDIHTTKTAESE